MSCQNEMSRHCMSGARQGKVASRGTQTEEGQQCHLRCCHEGRQSGALPPPLAGNWVPASLAQELKGMWAAFGSARHPAGVPVHILVPRSVPSQGHVMSRRILLPRRRL